MKDGFVLYCGGIFSEFYNFGEIMFFGIIGFILLIYWIMGELIGKI